MKNCKYILIPFIMLFMAACTAPTAPAPNASPSAAPSTTSSAAPASGSSAASSTAPAGNTVAANDDVKAAATQVLAEVNKGSEKLAKADSVNSIITIFKDVTVAIRPFTKKMKEKAPAMFEKDSAGKSKEVLGEDLDKKMNDGFGKFLEASGEAEKRNNVNPDNPELKAAGEDFFKALSAE